MLPVATNLAVGTLLFAAILTLVNSGMVLLYRTTGVLNFAQGYFMLLGAYVMSTTVVAVGYGLGLLVTMVCLSAVGVIVYQVVMRYVIHRPEWTRVIITLMVASLLAQLPPIVWGTGLRAISFPLGWGIRLGGARLPVSTIVTVAEAVVAVAVLVAFLRRTVTGTRMRALAMNSGLATYAGFRMNVLGSLAWAIAGSLGALAGVAYAQTTTVSLDISAVGLSAFPAAVLGGLDSLGGTILGGLVVAAVLTLASYWFGAVVGDMLAYLVMLAALVFVPFGFFGSRTTKRL